EPDALVGDGPIPELFRAALPDIRVELEGLDLEAAAHRVDAGALAETAPRTRRDFGAFAHLLAGRETGAGDLSLSAEGRMDRDGVTGEWFASRALAASAGLGALRVQVANRSSFSPPSLGDQFFRDGVGVAPNPDLRAVRVPNEWEAGASWASALGGAEVAASAAAYRGDVRGMIVWLPDFSFRWSPRNVDVRRRGVDTRAEVRVPAAARLRLAGSWSLADVVYDQPGDAVQVAYRPRHAALLEAEAAPGAWRAGVAARWTGERPTSVSGVNRLPGFWSVEMDVAREWRVGGWAATAAVRVDRLLDETESLIAGFPEPGRRLRLDLRLRRAEGQDINP
ncbi:MAG TPA: TonB-dependent receptor, partial [Longimicrobium sp.]|nr:TonB-dependent receptor [Longimicrobium sp.]